MLASAARFTFDYVFFNHQAGSHAFIARLPRRPPSAFTPAFGQVFLTRAAPMLRCCA